MQSPVSDLFAKIAFVIPMRVDCADRHWNLIASLGFLTRNFPGADVLVVEEDTESRIADVLARYPTVRHHLHLNGGSFKRAEGVNTGALFTDRRYVCIYDTDVLISPVAIEKSIRAMEREGWKIVLPFNHIFLDVSGALRERLGQSGLIGGFDRLCRMSDAKRIPDAAPRFLGGGICIVHREVFLAEGGLNRKMVSYGWEDTELVKRFEVLGYPVLSVPGFNLIHLDHARGVDSRPNEHYAVNEQEFIKVSRMTREQLMKYVETDLSLTCLGDSVGLTRVRRTARPSAPIAWLELRSFVNLVRIHLQAHGLRSLIARALPRGLRLRSP